MTEHQQIVGLLSAVLISFLISCIWDWYPKLFQWLRGMDWPTYALILVIMVILGCSVIPWIIEGEPQFSNYQGWYGSLLTIFVALLLGWIPLTHRSREIRAKNLRLACDWLHANRMALHAAAPNQFLIGDPGPEYRLVANTTRPINPFRASLGPATVHIPVKFEKKLLKLHNVIAHAAHENRDTWYKEELDFLGATEHDMFMLENSLANKALRLENS